MATALRDNEVQAVWQLDVFAGFMAAEGVPLRLLPAPAARRLTPSSCHCARRQPRGTTRCLCCARPQSRQGALSTLTNPAARCPIDVGALSRCGSRVHCAAASTPTWARSARSPVANQRIDQAPGRSGAPSPRRRWWRVVRGPTRRTPSIYFSNAFVAPYNELDPAPVIAAARNFKLTSP